VPNWRQEVTAAARNGFVRPGADDTYGDGDDRLWQSVDWPSITRSVDVGGQVLNVVDTGGDGPALLFIHGLGGAWQNWLRNIPAFMDDYRVIAPDLPGFGDSPLPADVSSVSIRSYAGAIDGLCDALGIESAAVVGNSMGGFVGAELALSFPTRVTRLVLVSAAGLSIENYRRTPLLTVTRGIALSGPLLSAGSHRGLRRPRLRRLGMQFFVRYPERLTPAIAYELARNTGKPGLVPGMKALLTYSFRDRLVEIEMPVLVLWGENDMLVPVGDAQEYVDLIGANARREVFADTGHLSMLERPTRFNALVQHFLAGEREPEAGVEGVSA
jgi:pimeloyl-ACP methyl ester carboxylesterase